MERYEAGLTTDFSILRIFATHREWEKYYREKQLHCSQFNEHEGICTADNRLNFIAFRFQSTTTQVKITGDRAWVEEIKKDIESKFAIVANSIEWLYTNDGQTVEVPLRSDRRPVDEMYPWLQQESLVSYYDRFMHSDANILLLIGAPGTGKTTFIRGLLQHTGENALVTYDSAILEKDFVFAQFIEGDTAIFVIEDADNFLGARSNGNNVMHKFLNVGDGLVSTKSKKMIFSTNLPSINDIDPALLRPGRCFDIVKFSLLTQDQAQVLSKALGVQLTESRDNWSIADIFHKQDAQSRPSVHQKFGFI